ncbi:hypothetical protein ACVWWK_002571 [Bradyrhizobium sp. LB9.1b]
MMRGEEAIMADSAIDKTAGATSPLEILPIFLKLGLTCFGGPIAHIGYFRDEFVVRRKWMDEHTYADLVGLCQFLPGPASSQVGFSIGLMKAGYLGALAAWTGFTLPSAAILVLFAYGAGALNGPVGAGLLHRAQADRGRHRDAGGLGHGAQPLSGPRTRLDRDGGGADHPLQHVVGRPDRSDRPWRACQSLAVP